VAVADFEGVCSSDIYVFEPKDERLLPELLPFLCQTEAFYEYAVGTSAGSLSPRTNWSQLANYEFALPPLEAQRQIAKMLLAVEDGKDSYYDLRSQSATLLNSTQERVFRNLLEASSVPNRYLGELLAVPIANGIFRKREQFGEGISLINVTDIYKSFRIATGELELVPVSTREYSRFSAMPNDVIFNRSSLVLAGIGYAALVPETKHEMVFDCHLMRARPNPNMLFGPYLARFAVSIYGRQHFLSRAQTTTMTTIGQSDLAELIIPCPDLSTQIMIAEQLDNTQASATRVEQRIHSLDTVKRSLLLCLKN
jgi:type I restriction enzyme S subunit